jgi:hypothetical protein
MKLASKYYKGLIITDPTTGVPVDADTYQSSVDNLTITVYKNNVVDTGLVLNYTNPSTGLYFISSSNTFTAAGFADGDRVDVKVTAILSTISYSAIIDSFEIDSAVAAIKVKTDYLPSATAGAVSGLVINDAATAKTGLQIHAAAQDALVANNLNYVAKDAATWATHVTKASIIDQMTSKDTNQTFARLTNSLEAIGTTVVAGVPLSVLASASAAPVYNTSTTSGGGAIAVNLGYTLTYLDNGSWWTVAQALNAPLDVNLTFACGAGNKVSQVKINGRFTAGTTRFCNVWAYNYLTSAYEQISDASNRMIHNNADQNYTYNLLSQHQKADGEVKIRFLSGSNTAGDALWLDQILVTCVTAGATPAQIADAVYSRMVYTVYEGGVWIDTVAGGTGVAGTELGYNGLDIRPCLTYADALVVAAALGVKRFYFKPDSTITLTQSHDYWRFIGKGVIHLGGQSIEDARFEGCEFVDGISIGDDADFIDSIIGNTTLAACTMRDCELAGKLTLVAGKNYTFHSCVDGLPAGELLPTIECKGTNAVGLRDWRGGLELEDMSATDSVKIDGQGRVVIGATCSNGDIIIRGNYTITDLSGGANSLSDAARFAEDQSLAVVGTVTNTVNANLIQILGTALTETIPTNIALAFKKFFDVASSIFTTASVNQGADSNVVLSKIGFTGASPYFVKADVSKIATADVNTTLAQLGVNVVSGGAGEAPTVEQIRTEMETGTGALLPLINNKTTNLPASPAAVGSAMVVSDKTGFSLSAAGVLAIWNQLTADVGIVASSFGKKLKDWVLGADSKVLISTDVQDLSTTLHVDAKTLNTAVPNNAIAAPTTGQIRTELATELGRIDVAVSTRSAPGTAQTITPPVDMALNSTVAKEATVAKDSTVAKDATVSKPAIPQVIIPPADMALNSTVAKEAQATLNKQEILDATENVAIDPLVLATLAKDATVAKEAQATINKDEIIASVVDVENKVDQLNFIGGIGAGSIEFFYYLYTNALAQTGPIANVNVWVTTDIEGQNIVASSRTNDFGKVTFFLDVGTYYFWRKKSGFDFTNPDTEVVS